MSNLYNAVSNNARTENDAAAYKSTNSKNLDLFFKAGASRRENIADLFVQAFIENPDHASRIAMWTRDVRGGAGERQQFRNFMHRLIYTDKLVAIKIMEKIPEIGRWDDLMVFWGTPLEEVAAGFWARAIQEKDGLACKWAPRKDKKGAKPIRNAMQMNSEQFRKVVVAGTDVVEQKMCANQWNQIDYEKVPSLASARYNSAFLRHDPAGRAEFRDKLESGEAKINAGAVYPYDVVRAAQYDDGIASAQWDALPNYLEGSEESFLPVVDVSGSMCTRVSGEISALDVSVSLGLYLAERNKSCFKNEFITFSSRPQMVKIKGNTLRAKYQNMESADWGMNTDLEAVFRLVLKSAIENSVHEVDMPTKILILSDMQFDSCVHGGEDETLFANMRKQYMEAGYNMPQVVFWNITGHDKGNVPVRFDTQGTAMVSGFSPAIMKSLLGGEMNPIKIMLDTIMDDRYTL